MHYPVHTNPYLFVKPVKQVTLHQGGIEDIFLDALKYEGVIVERPVEPQSISIDDKAASIQNPHAYAVTVNPVFLECPYFYAEKSFDL